MDGFRNFKKSVSFLTGLYYTIRDMKRLFSIILALFFIANNAGYLFADGYFVTEKSSCINAIDEKVLSFSKITDSFNANDGSLIVWIQDLHNDFSTQKKIYEILNILTKSSDFEVYGEGIIDETLDVSFFNSVTDKQIKEKAINNLFQASVLSGCEYFALLNGIKVKGIENKEIYNKNSKLLDEINKNKELNNFLIDNVLSYVNSLKKRSVLDKVISIQLSNLTEIGTVKDYPNLYKYQTVSKNLSGLNKRKLNDQLKNFVEEYADNPKIYSLLKQNSDYGYSKIYDYIKDENLSDVEKKNKELMFFLENTKLITEINLTKLVYEKESVLNELLSLQNLEKSEKEVLRLERYCSFLKDLVNTDILPQHYLELKENKKYAAALFNKYLSKNVSAFALSILNDKKFFDFYDTNIYRNEIFVKNLIKNSSNKIVVAGGFHSGITNELKKLNKSYTVLTPYGNLNSAFNKLFSTTLKYGTDMQTAEALLSVISSWRIFFADASSFQNEINKWISSNVLFADNTKISVTSNGRNGYVVTVKYKEASLTKTFASDDRQQSTKEQRLTKSMQNAVLDEIFSVASRINLFGQTVGIKTTSETSLLDANSFLPMSISFDNGKTVISVNETFLAHLYNDPTLIETAVKLLYFSYSQTINTESFVQFINTNSDKLQKIYSTKVLLSSTKSSTFSAIKTNVKNLISKISATIRDFTNKNDITEVPQEEITTLDEQNMAQALKQATIARQTRSYLKTFTQPPIGAFIRMEIPQDDDGSLPLIIEGKNFNNTDSVLHAETLTFVNFLKNYIREFEMLPSGKLSEKGTFLTQLLDLVVINGHHISNKTFQSRPMLLSNLGITVDYSQKRDINTVFNESNAVLKFVNEQLGNPLSGITLYCTLAPCNKCVRTMATLGIDRLVYGSPSVNQNHKGINTLLSNGIKVEGDVLQKRCDERIQNYRFMNASLLGTKIASIIQNVRRFVSFFLKKADKSLTALIDSVTVSERNVIDIKQTFTDLQTSLKWTNLQSDEKTLNRLIAFLKLTDAYDKPVKRAALIYAIKNNCSVKIVDGKILFYNRQKQQLDFYIGLDGKLAVSQNYLSKMEKLATVKNFADLDDNLALRDMTFNKDIQAIFSTLALYGIAQIIPVTGNSLDKVKIRLDGLTNAIKNLIPSIYIENAALSCNVIGGEFILNDSYMTDVAKSSLDEETIKYLETVIGDIQTEFYNIFVSFVTETKQLRKGDEFSYKDFIETLLKSQKTAIPAPIKDKITEWNKFSRKQTEQEIDKIYKAAINEKISKEKFLNVMKILSLVELSRLYFSQDPQDMKEAARLRQDIERIDNGQNLLQELTSPVRYIVTSFRANLIREKVADYFKRIIQQKYPDLEVISTGQTTLCVYKKGINKSVPLRNEIDNGTPAQNIIFSGDEFNAGGVDYPVYLLQQEEYSHNALVVINTNSSAFEGAFITLSELETFSSETSSAANIKRSVLLQRLILSIVEENIGLIAANPDYEPVNVAQELKERIYNVTQSVQFDAIPKTQSSTVSNMLKAA